MSIKELQVQIKISGNNVDYYEKLGYMIPRTINKYGKLTVSRGTEIIVEVRDLMPSSTVKVTKVCDICGSEAKTKSFYHRIVAHRKGSGGLDTCRECGNRKKTENYIKRHECLIDTHPHLVEALARKEDAYRFTGHSRKEIAIKCKECGHVFEKQICLITKSISSIFCPSCSDGIKYPEKFVRSLLIQLEEQFQQQKMFKSWFTEFEKKGLKRFYDFYLPESKCVIEVHGEQHYAEGFQGKRGRTLEQEQLNDQFKKIQALKNGITETNYIEIDARISSLEYLRNSILSSKMNIIWDLSNIDWVKCHEVALKTIVRIACNEWNNGMKSTKKISEKLGLGQKTILNYLKQGAEIGWCDYDANNLIYSRKPVIQLSLDGKYVNEFKSVSEAACEIGHKSGNGISDACRDFSRQAGGYRWMFKADYYYLKKGDKVSLPKLKVPLNKKKGIYQLDEDMNIINCFSSFLDAKKQTGITSIWEACNGKINTAGGYKWCLKDEYEKLTEEEKLSFSKVKIKSSTQKKAVYKLDENSFVVDEYESISEASKQTNVSASKISLVCNGKRSFAGGHKWIFIEDYKDI